jgi:xylulokinase
VGELLVGVDLGTTGTKTALYDRDGETLASAVARTPLQWKGPGEVEQDPEHFVATATQTIAACVAEAGADPGDVAAIGITGQMAGTMGIDGDWRPTTPYDSWLDLRCAPDVEALEREVGDELVALAGCPAMVNHAPKIRWCRRERPEEFAATAAFLPPSSFVAGRFAGLRGAEAFVDRSYLHFTGLAEAREGRWSALLADAVGVPIDKLPRIVEPATVVGELTAEAAGACGLRTGIPIAAGLGDTAAGVLGAGIVRPGQLLDTAGTAAVFAISTVEHRPDSAERTLIVMRGALPGQWIALSYLSGGGLLDWLNAAVAAPGPAERQLTQHGVEGAAAREAEDAARDEGEETDYAGLGELAEMAPAGSDGLVFLPYLDGRLLPSQPTQRGAWIGLHRQHRRQHLTRSVLESVAYEYSIYLRVMRTLHPELDPGDVRVIGGGARSEAWCRIKASVLGLPYVRLHRDEFSCWGAALVAGGAVGLYDDLAAAAERATDVHDSFAPDPGSAETYGHTRAVYEHAVEALGPSGKPLAAAAAGAGGRA